VRNKETESLFPLVVGTLRLLLGHLHSLNPLHVLTRLGMKLKLKLELKLGLELGLNLLVVSRRQ
jgi:hypothetical protein